MECLFAVPCCSNVLSFDNLSCWKMSLECQSLQLPCLPFACCTPAGIVGGALLLFFCGGGEGKILHLQTWSLCEIRKSCLESSCSYQYQRRKENKVPCPKRIRFHTMVQIDTSSHKLTKKSLEIIPSKIELFK